MLSHALPIALALQSLSFDDLQRHSVMTTLSRRFRVQGMEALISIAKEPWNVRQADLTMSIQSPMSDSLCFALPLLSFKDGKWSSVIEMVCVKQPGL